ncbi:hypothetical protein EDC04DRAFT_3093001 [Pisolithus marmoratus]|nr:hypothetical protein EDC04DRAFT_3093001 [Pisolithus marmoratus]
MLIPTCCLLVIIMDKYTTPSRDPLNVSIGTWTPSFLGAAVSNILLHFDYVELDWRVFEKAIHIRCRETVHDAVCAADWACDAFQRKEYAIDAYNGHGFWETQGSPDRMHADDILANRQEIRPDLFGPTYEGGIPDHYLPPLPTLPSASRRLSGGSAVLTKDEGTGRTCRWRKRFDDDVVTKKWSVLQEGVNSAAEPPTSEGTANAKKERNTRWF